MQKNNNQDRTSKNNRPAPENQNNQHRNGNQNNKQRPINTNLTTSRGQAVRAQRRSQADAQRIANQYVAAENTKPPRANVIDDSPRLRIIGLGGMDGGGSKNMIVVEYMHDAIIMDCGNDLS